MRDFDPTASEFISSGYLQKSKPGRGAMFYDPMSIGSAIAGPVIGGMFGGGGGGGSSPQQQQQPQQPQGFGYAPAMGLTASGFLGSNAARQSADIQGAAADRATEVQSGLYNQARDNLAPYMQGGNVALSSLMGKMGNGELGGQFTPSDYLANKDPGYDFQLQQGNQALQNSQAAHNGVLSGSSLKGLIDYNQGMASTGYQNAYQRWLQMQQNTYGQLSNTAKMGQGAASELGNISAPFGKGMSDTITGAGNVRGAGIIGSANALQGSINGLAGSVGLNNMMSGVGRGIGNMFGSPFNQNNQEHFNEMGIDTSSNDYYGNSGPDMQSGGA